MEGRYWHWRKLGNCPWKILRSHSHTHRTLDSLNHVECPPPPPPPPRDRPLCTTYIIFGDLGNSLRCQKVLTGDERHNGPHRKADSERGSPE